MPRIRFAFFVFLLCSVPLLKAQQANRAQDWVQRLYPKDDRLKLLRLGEIADELKISDGSQIADVGCGPAQISIVLSHLVGVSGRIYCEDISRDSRWGIPRARKNIKKQKARNITVVAGTVDDPKLPRSLDAVLIVNAYHEMSQFSAMLRHLRESLKPGGRLVIVDNSPNRTAVRSRAAQVDNHVLSMSLAAGEVETAGFRIIKREDVFADNPDSESAHWLIAAERP